MNQTRDQEIFDSDQLLRRMMGDRELAVEIITEFLVDLSSQLANLKASIAQGDETRIARGIHTIKGASANVGALELARLAHEAEGSGIANSRTRHTHS